MYVCVWMVVARSYLTPCDLMDCSLLGSSVLGILQAKILEWVAIISPGDLPNPGIENSLVAQTVKHLPTTWETWVRSLGWEDLLEKEMATHSSILAWKIPWTEEPGRPQSMGSQRVGRDWATFTLLYSCIAGGFFTFWYTCSKTRIRLLWIASEKMQTYIGGSMYQFFTEAHF